MYFGPKKHILSNVILSVTLIRLVSFVTSGIVRVIVRRGGMMPDMMDEFIWKIQTYIAFISIVACAMVFIYALKLVNRYISVIPREDRMEIAKLQEESFGESNSALNSETIRNLLETWFVVFVGVQLMYEFFSGIYRQFVGRLYMTLNDAQGAGGEMYNSLYNLSHSFKYQGMLIALLLGVIMTAIFLNDRILKMITVISAILYLLSAAGLEMSTISVMGKPVGIVWSSFIFHIIDTIGMVILALYLRKKYNGV